MATQTNIETHETVLIGGTGRTGAGLLTGLRDGDISRSSFFDAEAL
jgi:hypothetical protein